MTDTPSMNELLRAAAGVLTPRQRAELEGRTQAPEPTGPVTGSADGGQLGTTSERPPSPSQVMSALARDAIWARRYGRPRARTVDELRYAMDETHD